MNVSPPTAMTFTQEQLQAQAKDYLTKLYGRPGKDNDVDKWMEHFGLLCGFIDEQFKPTPPHPNVLPSVPAADQTTVDA